MQRRTKHYNSVCPQQLYDRHNKAFTFVACGAVQDIALDYHLGGSALRGLDAKDFKMHRSGDPLGPNAHRSHVFESLGVWTVDLVVLARLDGRASRIIPVVSKARQGVTVFT